MIPKKFGNLGTLEKLEKLGNLDELDETGRNGTRRDETGRNVTFFLQEGNIRGRFALIIIEKFLLDIQRYKV